MRLPRSACTGTDEQAAQEVRQVLVWVMTRTLALLHPFMPYITEEIWQAMPHDGDALIVSSYPAYDESLTFDEAASRMESVMAAVRGVRNRRSEMNVAPGRRTKLYIATAKPRCVRAGQRPCSSGSPTPRRSRLPVSLICRAP